MTHPDSPSSRPAKRRFLPVAMVIVAATAYARPAPPYIGVSYYPEVAGPQISEDISKMNDIGVNLVRFGEFSWSRMETNDGQYNFGWLHKAVKSFADAGIAIELCTPTAAPPVWLSQAHPDILRVNSSGQTITHGGRRQYCPNSATYRRYAIRIAGKLAEEFADHPSVISWQVDNEFWESCYCKNCERAFHLWLKNHFGTIDKLNAAWLYLLIAGTGLCRQQLFSSGEGFWPNNLGCIALVAPALDGTIISTDRSLGQGVGGVRRRFWRWCRLRCALIG